MESDVLQVRQCVGSSERVGVRVVKKRMKDLRDAYVSSGACTLRM
jgi:hypothetical protein